MSPGMPTGWQADDILICQAVTENNATLSIASGWTLVDSTVSTAGQNTRGAWWWRRAVAGDTAPSVTGATGGAMACIHAFRGCTTSGNPYNTYSVNAAASGSLTMTVATITPGSSSDMIVWLGNIEAEFGTTSVSGYSGTDPTFTEGMDDTNSSGSNYTGMCMAYGLTTDGAATGSRTATVSTPTTCFTVNYLIALTPAGAGTQSYSYTGSGGLQFGSTAARSYVRNEGTRTGGLQTGGTGSRSYVRAEGTRTGGLQFGGSGTRRLGFSVTPSGGLQFGGSGVQSRVRSEGTPAGGLQFGGTATYSSNGTKSFSYTGSGGLVFAGTAAQIRKYAYSGVGGLQFGGTADYISIPVSVGGITYVIRRLYGYVRRGR